MSFAANGHAVHYSDDALSLSESISQQHFSPEVSFNFNSRDLNRNMQLPSGGCNYIDVEENAKAWIRKYRKVKMHYFQDIGNSFKKMHKC